MYTSPQIPVSVSNSPVPSMIAPGSPRRVMYLPAVPDRGKVTRSL